MGSGWGAKYFPKSNGSFGQEQTVFPIDFRRCMQDLFENNMHSRGGVGRGTPSGKGISEAQEEEAGEAQTSSGRHSGASVGGDHCASANRFLQLRI